MADIDLSGRAPGTVAQRGHLTQPPPMPPYPQESAVAGGPATDG